jgi:topoisomerase-4 subunit B
MAKAAQASLFDTAFDPIPAPAPANVAAPAPAGGAYSAKDIEVLEGLEPVRTRPGMYIGGIDERALHHLFAEVLDNSMDEAVAGHAKIIEVSLAADGALTVRDDGRGMPVDPHPKFPGKSALEVILTVLHSGGKFSGKAYETSGGLHGVGVSVVNALSETLEITVWKDGFEWRHPQARHRPHLPAGPGDLQGRRRLPSRPPAPHGQVQGLSLPGGGDPLEMRARAHP